MSAWRPLVGGTATSSVMWAHGDRAVGSSAGVRGYSQPRGEVLVGPWDADLSFVSAGSTRKPMSSEYHSWLHLIHNTDPGLRAMVGAR